MWDAARAGHVQLNEFARPTVCIWCDRQNVLAQHECIQAAQRNHRLGILFLWRLWLLQVIDCLQVPAQQLHQLANQRLPMHLQQLNTNPQLQARPQGYHAGLGNATYIPGTGLQYGNAAHLQQRAPLSQHASDAAYLQQDPNVLAAATAATANAAALKRAAGLPPHVQQQLLSHGQLAPRPSASPFEANDINLAGWQFSSAVIAVFACFYDVLVLWPFPRSLKAKVYLVGSLEAPVYILCPWTCIRGALPL